MPVPGRRAEPARHLGHEARRAERGPRAVQADPDQRPRHPDQRDLPADGEARRQVRAGPLGLLRGRGGARHRPPDDADRPAVPGRHRVPARRLRARVPEGREGRHPAARAAAAADRQHRRQHAARPDRRLPRQGVRPVRAQRRSVGPGLQGARPAAARLHHRDPRRPAPQPARPGRRRREAVRSRAPTRGC